MSFAPPGHACVLEPSSEAGFPLTNLLLPLLRRSAPARVVNVASADQAPVDINDIMLGRAYDGWHPYRQSELAQIMLTFDLAARIEGTGW